MKNIFILLFIFGTQFSMFSQEKFEDQVKYIKRNIEIVKEQEKAALKAKIEEINQKLENKEITQAQADEMKKSEAEKSANQIALRIEPFELELRELVKGEVNEDSETKVIRELPHWMMMTTWKKMMVMTMIRRSEKVKGKEATSKTNQI